MPGIHQPHSDLLWHAAMPILPVVLATPFVSIGGIPAPDSLAASPLRRECGGYNTRKGKKPARAYRRVASSRHPAGRCSTAAARERTWPPYLDQRPRSLTEFQRDRLLALLDDHPPEEFVRVIWADGSWAMLTAGEMVAELRADPVVNAENIDRLEFLSP